MGMSLTSLSRSFVAMSAVCSGAARSDKASSAQCKQTEFGMRCPGTQRNLLEQNDFKQASSEQLRFLMADNCSDIGSLYMHPEVNLTLLNLDCVNASVLSVNTSALSYGDRVNLSDVAILGDASDSHSIYIEGLVDVSDVYSGGSISVRNGGVVNNVKCESNVDIVGPADLSRVYSLGNLSVVNGEVKDVIAEFGIDIQDCNITYAFTGGFIQVYGSGNHSCELNNVIAEQILVDVRADVRLDSVSSIEGNVTVVANAEAPIELSDVMGSSLVSVQQDHPEYNITATIVICDEVVLHQKENATEPLIVADIISLEGEGACSFSGLTTDTSGASSRFNSPLSSVMRLFSGVVS